MQSSGSHSNRNCPLSAGITADSFIPRLHNTGHGDIVLLCVRFFIYGKEHSFIFFLGFSFPVTTVEAMGP